jgi:hypothetical protein
MILTSQEACDLLEFPKIEDMPDKVNTVFLPAVDGFLKNATGKDWGTLTETYTAIDAVAKMAAGSLLVGWFENPELIGRATDGVIGLIGQLKAKVVEESAVVV